MTGCAAVGEAVDAEVISTVRVWPTVASATGLAVAVAVGGFGVAVGVFATTEVERGPDVASGEATVTANFLPTVAVEYGSIVDLIVAVAVGAIVAVLGFFSSSLSSFSLVAVGDCLVGVADAVAVGKGGVITTFVAVASGSSVAVGLRFVAVGGVVAVAGTAVAVGAGLVAVGAGVLVGGTFVAVAGISVAVGSGVLVAAMVARDVGVGGLMSLGSARLLSPNRNKEGKNEKAFLKLKPKFFLSCDRSVSLKYPSQLSSIGKSLGGIGNGYISGYLRAKSLAFFLAL